MNNSKDTTNHLIIQRTIFYTLDNFKELLPVCKIFYSRTSENCKYFEFIDIKYFNI